MRARIDQLARVNEYFHATSSSFFFIKSCHLDHCSITYPEMTPEAQLAAWSILLALATLDSILSSRLKLYKYYFVTQSKKNRG